jgi:hypothetical protein
MTKFHIEATVPEDMLGQVLAFIDRHKGEVTGVNIVADAPKKAPKAPAAPGPTINERLSIYLNQNIRPGAEFKATDAARAIGVNPPSIYGALKSRKDISRSGPGTYKREQHG